MHSTIFLALIAGGASLAAAAPRALNPRTPLFRRNTTSLDFGKCTDPGISFGIFDGRTEDSFEPRDKTEFDHGSALNINIITQFIGDRLNDECAAPSDTVSAARAAASQVSGMTGQGAADAWNDALGVGNGNSTNATSTAVAAAASSSSATSSSISCKGTGAAGSSSSGSASSGSSSSGSGSSGSTSSSSGSSGSSSSSSGSSGSGSGSGSSSSGSSSGSSSSSSSGSSSSSSGSSSGGSSADTGSSTGTSSSVSCKGTGAASSSSSSTSSSGSSSLTSSSSPSNGSTTGCNSDLVLLSSNVQNGSTATGLLGGSSEAGQSASATNDANFINFCSDQTLTNGQQVKTGSCNGIVMGQIPSTENMVSSILVFPLPGSLSNIQHNTTFNISVQVSNLQAGSFTNATTTYYAAPQQVSSSGQIIGHTHVTVQTLGDSLTPSTPPDPQTFVFFKGINDSGNGDGLLQAEVLGGLDKGNYRVCSMTSASNHQPVLMPVAQRGAQDDCTKFTVS